MLAGGSLAFVFGVPALFGSTFGLFMVPLQQSQGWSRGEIAFSLTLTTMVAWFAVLISGWLMDHVRLRPLLFVGIVFGAANLAAFSLIGANVWTFYVMVVALAFTSMGASPLALSKIVQGWFETRVGTALGMLYACGAVGGVLHPLIMSSVIAGAGWRQAFLLMGAMALVGGLVAALGLIREPPAVVPIARPANAPVLAAAKSLMIAFLGNPTWWKLALWNFLFAMGSGFIMIHFASLLHDRGATPGQIGAALSVVGASHFAGNLLAGWLVDRVSPRRMAALLMLMPLAAAQLMLKGQGYAALVAAASILGLASGSDCRAPRAAEGRSVRSCQARLRGHGVAGRAVRAGRAGRRRAAEVSAPGQRARLGDHAADCRVARQPYQRRQPVPRGHALHVCLATGWRQTMLIVDVRFVAEPARQVRSFVRLGRPMSLRLTACERNIGRKSDRPTPTTDPKPLHRCNAPLTHCNRRKHPPCL